ncbi:hypothetical protein OSB04_024626 [Centaurea solstitialis]|uniref:Integrase catalytic domain-containing protein n=1 Tax=Centaurea solstitialis TaxID=347529 RepID=A0AA38SLI3_9ASTR|nr:hypothetical protein OSB04_024626 [Centaurea solstitialis]
MNKLVSKHLVKGLLETQLSKDTLYSACEKGKMTRSSHPPKMDTNCQHPLDMLHMDLCGPMRVESLAHKKHMLVLVDEYSRYTWLEFLRAKFDAAYLIIAFIKWIQVLLGRQVKKLKSDNGTEFRNVKLGSFLEEVGITHNFYTLSGSWWPFATKPKSPSHTTDRWWWRLVVAVTAAVTESRPHHGFGGDHDRRKSKPHHQHGGGRWSLIAQRWRWWHCFRCRRRRMVAMAVMMFFRSPAELTPHTAPSYGQVADHLRLHHQRGGGSVLQSRWWQRKRYRHRRRLMAVTKWPSATHVAVSSLPLSPADDDGAGRSGGGCSIVKHQSPPVGGNRVAVAFSSSSPVDGVSSDRWFDCRSPPVGGGYRRWVVAADDDGFDHRSNNDRWQPIAVVAIIIAGLLVMMIIVKTLAARADKAVAARASSTLRGANRAFAARARLTTHLRHERKWYVLEEPLGEAPPANASAAVRNAHKKHSDDLLDVGCLMLATMSPDLQTGLINTNAYDMICQLRDMFQTMPLRHSTSAR